MLIICPSCATAYRIELANLGENGRQVRCARCRTMWLATAESAVPEMVEAGPGDAEATRTPDDPPSRPQGDDGAGSELAAGDWSTDSPADSAQPGEPVEVATQDAPSLIPGENAGSVDHVAAPPVGDDIESIAARRTLARPHRTRGLQFKLSRPGLPATIMMLAAALAAVITWRAPIVRLLPQTASLFSAVGLSVNLRGLGFENLKTSHEFQDGMTVLVVEGSIVNVTKDTVEVPRLRFALRNSIGQEVYAWTALPARSALGPKDSLAFRTRLASPPGDGRDVVVRFFTRHDLISGTR